ncbi:exopolygalacturonase [Manihot esculenta]|uniref:exopolygalacturonase n=1 Tax=Manihot esculenta TaxID=3983 RepID=UPI001CC52EA8|nr:exopolygalacturonase [Manihot esculenta]
MDTKIIFSIVSLLFINFSLIQAQPAVFDITKFGAAPNGKADASKAIADAWKEACAAAGSSKILIPAGTFLAGIVNVTGPCKGAIEVEVQGTVQAPPELAGGDGWFNFITKGLVRDITSLNSKYFYVNVLGCEDFTFEGFKVSTPESSLNTDGIHIGRSKGVTISNAKIGTGDDCISIGDGTENLKITKVACGPGHDISIGSLGKYENEDPVSGITVSDCTLTGTTNGVRIKTWPALFPNTATNIHFQYITMENVSNPIIVDQMYCPWNKCNKKEPSKVKISDVSFKNIKGTSATALTVQLICSSGIPCEKVELANIDLTYSGPEGPAKSECIDVKLTIVGKIPEGCKRVMMQDASQFVESDPSEWDGTDTFSPVLPRVQSGGVGSKESSRNPEMSLEVNNEGREQGRVSGDSMREEM